MRDPALTPEWADRRFSILRRRVGGATTRPRAPISRRGYVRSDITRNAESYRNSTAFRPVGGSSLRERHAIQEAAGLLRLWRLRDTELVTSAYSAEEARRNLDTAEARARLEDLLATVRLVPESVEPLPRTVRLAEKDEPILRSALAANATHLLTGDVRDFGRLLGKKVSGVLIQLPGDYLRKREGRR